MALVVKSKIKAAIKDAPKETESDRQRIQQIKTNKKSARDAERQNRVKPTTVDASKSLAKVVPLKQADDDYSLPSFVPSLFFDDDGETK